jgi:putative membrane protein
MNIIVRLVLSAIAVIITSYILPGVAVDGFGAALIVGLVIIILDAIVKPILVILTLPVTILTLGLFLFVINAIIILIADSIVPGFSVDGFLWALVFSLILSVINSFLMNTAENK